MDALIIKLAISNSLDHLIFRSSDQYACQISSRSDNLWAVTCLSPINILGGHLVAKKPYLTKTMRYIYLHCSSLLL